MPGCAPEQQHGAQQGRVLRLTALELEGFKSFRDRAVIGPLDDFTCVVGPNGCGKSVVGEAVAFALGGNRKMLRAGSVAALLNQELAAAGHRTAEVVLHMELLQHSPAAPRLSSQKQLCSSSPSQPLPATNTSTHSPAVTDQPHPTNTTTSPASTHVALDQHQQQSNSQQQQPQQMKLRRVLRGDVTKSYIMRPGSSSWTAVTQAQLQTELAPYGIDTQCIDRYIVTQSRQAVDVSDAVGLVKQLEGLTGAVDYEEAIARHSTGLEHLAASMEETKAQIDRLEDQRELLAPAVTHWQEVQQLQEIVSTTKLQLLTDQQAHGSKLLVLQAQQVEATADRVAGAAEALESARTKESELLQQRAVLDKELLVSKRREEQLVKQVSKLSAAAASAGVQHSSAVSAAKDNSSLMKALQKKLAQHDQQEAQHKTQVEEGTEQLRVLQEAAAAAQEQLAAARTKAAAAARTQPGAKASNTLSAAAKEAQQQQQSLQQQLSDLTCQTQLLIARQAAATSKATRAAKAVDALQQRTEAAAAAAAGQARGLSEAEQEVQAAAAAVAASRDRSSAAEERWRAAELQQQTLLDQLGDFQQQQQQGQQQHNTHTALETSPSYDTAVQHLTAASSGGQLPGQFYGRLCNLAAVSDASAQPAVNAVLRERCNLATMMVVSDRATAAAVIDHFRQQRIGTVNCKILSELQQQRGPSYIQPAAAAAGGGGMSRPLLDLVQYDGTAVPGLQQLMEQLLGGWLLVESREVALQLLHLRKSMVTRSGEVFKADGEIVASFGGPPSNSSGNRNTALAAYSLATGAPVPIPTVTASNNATGPRPDADAAAAAASRAAAAEDARRLKQQLAAVQQQLHAAEQECQAARLGVLQAEQQQAAAEGKLQRLRQQQRHGAGGRAGSTSAEQLQQQLQEALQKQAAAAGELTAAEAPLAAVLQQREQLQHELTAVTAAAAAAVDAGRDKAATAAAARLQEAEQAAGQAEAAVEEAWQLVHKAEQQQRRAAGRAAAISKEVAKVQAALDGTAVEQLQAKVDLLRQQLSDTQSELQQVRSEAVSISSKVKPVRKQLAKAAIVKEKAAAVLDEAQANQQQAQAALKELQQQQEHRAQLLSKLQPRSAPSTAAAGDATAAAAAAGHKKARTGSSSQGDDRHGSGSGVEDQQQQQEQQQEDQELQDVDAGVAAPTPAAAQEDVEMGFPAPAGAVQGGVSQGDMQADRQGVSTEKQHKRRTRAGTSSRKGSKAATLPRSTRARVIQDSSSSSGADDELSSSSSSSEEEKDDANVAAFTAASRTRRAAAAAPPAAANTAAVSRAGVRGRKGARAGSMQAAAHNSKEKAGAVAAMRPVLSAAVLGKQTALLQQRQQKLDEQELELQQEYAKVDKAALQQDLAALQGLAAAHSTLQQLQQQREAAATALEVLLDERYSRLLAVLQQLNSRLDAVYGLLTGGCGKAYCSYTAERQLLFSQGVTLHVQPDGSTWRRMGMLSGGQRSLATLALSFALQALFPSPFYFFDEVDCALDTSAAARVAAYVRQQCSGAAAAQYLFVSHKPVVFESAGCLLGVYSNGRGSSAAVVGHFGRQEAGA